MADPRGPEQEGGAVDLSDGRLWQLGSSVKLPAPISWLPTNTRGWEPVNAYLMLEDDGALLVDTGVRAHSGAVLRELVRLVGRDRPIDIFLTRFEQDCLGNVGQIFELANLRYVYAASAQMHPLEFFGEITARRTPEEIVAMFRRAQGAVQVGAERELEVVRTMLRILATTWAYDSATGTLFTSDSFGHVQGHSSDQRIARPGETTPRQIRHHLLTKFDWAADMEDATAVANAVEDAFSKHTVRRIAPTHGCVIEGEDEVAWHVERVLDALHGRVKEAVS
jgi:flavorubredoxin